jgi:hypothetical protein
MQIDTEHLHYWMQAIRQSPDIMRTMDAFWSGQIKSKEWLIKILEEKIQDSVSIDIFGGWVGTLSSMLFQSNLSIKNITSYDIDPSCEPIAVMMNKKEEMEGRFKAYTRDMCETVSTADLIINTSCEHLTQPQYDKWLSQMPKDKFIVLQSNNYDIPEHIRLAASLIDFRDQCKLKSIHWAGTFELPLYTRYMIIGKR